MTVPTSPPTAVLFDWGGTLTPFHPVDLAELWQAAAAVLAPDRVEQVAQALAEAEQQWWRAAVASGRSGTTADVVAAAAARTGLDVDWATHDWALHDRELHARALTAHRQACTPNTVSDSEAAPLLQALRERGLRTGLLSNTHWPREWHECWLARDGLLDLLDGRVYTSDLAHLKPHPEAFRAALAAVGKRGEPVAPAEAVFVGDRPLDDIAGAKSVGMRAVLVRNSRLPADAVPASPVQPDATISRLSELLDLIDSWS